MINTVQLLSVISRFALAAAIIYLAYQLAQIVNSLPEIDRSLARVTQQVPPTLEALEKARFEITELRKLVPQVLTETAAIRGQIPPILEEVAQVRQSLPPVMEEVAKTRRQLPSVLERVDKTIAVVDQTQRQIPRILESTDRAVTSIDNTREQVESLAPQVLSEIRRTREQVDPTLDRVDGLINNLYLKARETVNNAEGAGQEVSEGAITGIVTGALKLPFRLIGSLLSPFIDNIEPNVAQQLTQRDIELMVDAGNRASNSGKLDQMHKWQNTDSGNSGSITLLRSFQINQSECVEVRITIDLSGERDIDELESFCQNQEGRWVSAPAPESSE